MQLIGSHDYEWQKLLRELEQRGVTPAPLLIPQPAPNCGTCDDIGWIVRAVPVGHPDFGRSFPCPDCNATAFIQSRINRLLEAMPRLDRYHNASIESLVARCGGDTSGKDEAIRVSKMVADGDWVTDLEGEKYYGALFTGSYGVGKTGLMAIALMARTRAGNTTACLDWNLFADQTQDTYNQKQRDDKETAPTKTELLKSMIDVDYLLIDELGHFNQRGQPILESPDRQKTLGTLISGRHSRMKGITMITSNLSVAELRMAFGEYVVQRILEMCLLVPVGGVPLRNTQGEGKHK